MTFLQKTLLCIAKINETEILIYSKIALYNEIPTDMSMLY